MFAPQFVRQVAGGKSATLARSINTASRCTSTLLASSTRTPIATVGPTKNLHYRTITTTLPAQRSKQDLEDRESINTESTEHSKSGGDSAVAQNEDAAFNPNKTSPEEEEAAASQGNEVNPLGVSGADKDVSKTRDPQEGGAEKGAEKKPSGKGETNKGKKF